MRYCGVILFFLCLQSSVFSHEEKKPAFSPSSDSRLSLKELTRKRKPLSEIFTLSSKQESINTTEKSIQSLPSKSPKLSKKMHRFHEELQFNASI